jgi:hypothetical protein
MRQGAAKLQGFVGSDKPFALEDAAEAIDLIGRPEGEVGEGAFADAAAFAPAFAEQDGGGGVAVGDCLHVHGNIISLLLMYVKI